MKTLKKVLAGTTLVVIVSMLFLTNLEAQTITEFYNEKEDTFVLKLEDFEADARQTKIILVYDSNLITLETQSANQFSKNILASSIITCISSAGGSSGNMLLEDFEEGIEVEDWMLDSFKVNGQVSESLVADDEEAIELEDWMNKPGTWLN